MRSPLITAGAAVATALGHAWMPEPWDIAATVLAVVQGAVAVLLFAVARSRKLQRSSARGGGSSSPCLSGTYAYESARVVTRKRKGKKAVIGARLRLATRGDDSAHHRRDEIEAALEWLLNAEPEEHEARHQPEAPYPTTPDGYHFVSGLHVVKSTSVGPLSLSKN